MKRVITKQAAGALTGNQTNTVLIARFEHNRFIIKNLYLSLTANGTIVIKARDTVLLSTGTLAANTPLHFDDVEITLLSGNQAAGDDITITTTGGGNVYYMINGYFEPTGGITR